MSRPLRFQCERTINAGPETLIGRILDLTQWPGFAGWGPLPGIRAAHYHHQPPGRLGAIIHVQNRDGSTHTETITAFQPARAITLRLDNFTAPIRHLATHFDEHWDFIPAPNGGTRITRTLEIHPRGPFARPLLHPLAWMLKKALTRHLNSL